MDTEKIIGTLKSVLVDDMHSKVERDQIDSSTALMDGGLDLDSVAIVELIGAVEDRFGIQFDDSDLRMTTFQDVNSLAQVIAKRLAGSDD